MKRIFIFAAAISVLPQGISAASDAGSRASYLRGNLAGARYVAMGQCGEALADDVYSIYWNPAGLVRLKARTRLTPEEILDRARAGEANRITENELLSFSEPASEGNAVQVGLSGAMLDVDRNAFFGGAAFGLFGGVAGVGINSTISTKSESYYAYDENNRPLGRRGNTVYAGSAAYLSYGFGLGITSFGFSLKGLYERIANYSYAGAGLDAGVQVSVLSFLRFGAVIQDMGTGLVPVNGGSELKKKYDLAMPSFRISGLITNDAEFTLVFGMNKKFEQDKLTFCFGVQYDVWKYLSLAAGINGVNFSAGATIKIRKFELSYAFVFDGIDDGANHVLSASMLF